MHVSSLYRSLEVDQKQLNSFLGTEHICFQAFKNITHIVFKPAKVSDEKAFGYTVDGIQACSNFSFETRTVSTKNIYYDHSNCVKSAIKSFIGISSFSLSPNASYISSTSSLLRGKSPTLVKIALNS